MNASLRIALVLLGLLSVGDITGLALTDGDHPPYAIAATGAVLGVASLFFVARAWTGSRSAVRPLLALRIVSAVTAAPAFFVHGVPTVAKASAGAIIGLTAAGVLLIGRPTTSPVVTR
ncbi:MAG: hypothetical protein QOJ78_756 [Pseudonocardiales bacterium]|nr:hypothetical protein [Pseudonocardiales bacterium]